MSLISDPFSSIEIERNTLKDQAINLLRDLIIGGHIAPGAKITERDVAARLGVSRMPARDALMVLEKEGLIVSRLNARYVIELNEQEIRHLYMIRLALEKLAVEQAIVNSTPDSDTTIKAIIEQMRQAITQGEISRYTSADLELHRTLWEQAGNPYLLKMLNSMIGPIFMFISTQSRIVEDWQTSLALHEELVTAICDRNQVSAANSIEKHINHSLALALKAFQSDQRE